MNRRSRNAFDETRQRVSPIDRRFVPIRGDEFERWRKENIHVEMFFAFADRIRCVTSVRSSVLFGSDRNLQRLRMIFSNSKSRISAFRREKRFDEHGVFIRVDSVAVFSPFDHSWRMSERGGKSDERCDCFPPERIHRCFHWKFLVELKDRDENSFFFSSNRSLPSTSK